MYQFSCFSLSISGPDTPQFLVAVQNEDQQLKKKINQLKLRLRKKKWNKKNRENKIWGCGLRGLLTGSNWVFFGWEAVAAFGLGEKWKVGPVRGGKEPSGRVESVEPEEFRGESCLVNENGKECVWQRRWAKPSPTSHGPFFGFRPCERSANIKHVVVVFLGNLHKPPNGFPFYINATLQVPIIPWTKCFPFFTNIPT